MSADPDAVASRAGAIEETIKLVADDELEGFAFVGAIDGEYRAMSFTPLDEDPEQYADYDVCRLPRNELLGKLLADFAMMYGRDPADVADVAAHVATDHFGVDETRARAFQREFLEGGSDD